MLHGSPAKRKSAVTPESDVWTLLAIYPGQPWLVVSRSTVNGEKRRHHNERQMSVVNDIMRDEVPSMWSNAAKLSAAGQLSTVKNISGLIYSW